MPGIRDKILVDSLLLEGDFKALNHLGEEVEKHGLLKQAEPQRKKLAEACKAFRELVAEVTSETEKLINDHVVK